MGRWYSSENFLPTCGDGFGSGSLDWTGPCHASGRYLAVTGCFVLTFRDKALTGAAAATVIQGRRCAPRSRDVDRAAKELIPHRRFHTGIDVVALGRVRSEEHT